MQPASEKNHSSPETTATDYFGLPAKFWAEAKAQLSGVNPNLLSDTQEIVLWKQCLLLFNWWYMQGQLEKKLGYDDDDIDDIIDLIVSVSVQN